MQGHYIEGRNFDELAAELGLSKSWASRMHTRALGRLRERARQGLSDARCRCAAAAVPRVLRLGRFEPDLPDHLEPAAAPRVRLVERGDLVGRERVHGRARARRVPVRPARRLASGARCCSYACAELGVALFALLVPLLVDARGLRSPRSTPRCASASAPSRLPFMLARFLCIVPVLIVPTTLMGATLAAALAPLRRSATTARPRSARGSARCTRSTRWARSLGVFLAGFVLMPNFGVRATNAVAVVMNVVLAAGHLALRKRLGESGAAGAEPAARAESARRCAAPAGAAPFRRARASAGRVGVRALRLLLAALRGRLVARAGQHHRRLGLLVRADPDDVPDRHRASAARSRRRCSESPVRRGARCA